jgi:hypothetical protein
MSGFGSNSLYLLFLKITIDFGTIYNAFEQRFDRKKILNEEISVKNQLQISRVILKLMVPNSINI